MLVPKPDLHAAIGHAEDLLRREGSPASQDTRSRPRLMQIARHPNRVSRRSRFANNVIVPTGRSYWLSFMWRDVDNARMIKQRAAGERGFDSPAPRPSRRSPSRVSIAG